eukprot:1411978-Alexandrium_andersonii.AAC.1
MAPPPRREVLQTALSCLNRCNACSPAHGRPPDSRRFPPSAAAPRHFTPRERERGRERERASRPGSTTRSRACLRPLKSGSPGGSVSVSLKDLLGSHALFGLRSSPPGRPASLPLGPPPNIQRRAG